MAAADLASLLIHPWVFLIYNFFQNYQLGVFGCKVEGAIECKSNLRCVINDFDRKLNRRCDSIGERDEFIGDKLRSTDRDRFTQRNEIE